MSGATLILLALAQNGAGVRDHLLTVFGRGPSNSEEPHIKPSPEMTSIAVLPLASLSRDPEDEFFADGMTDALISELSRSGSLLMISRTSSMRYKHTVRPVSEIARELKVGGIVEGSVLKAGDRVRISVNLIDPRTDKHLWSDTYERDVRHILDLQAEVAGAIARGIRATVASGEDRPLASHRPLNPEAFDAYLRGRFHLSGGNPQDAEMAEKFFKVAVERDPNYAPAYAGLAMAWVMRGHRGHLRPLEALPLAKQAAMKALELDNTLGEAHLASANISFFYDWDWQAAERECQLSIKLDPSRASARVLYSDFLNVMKRPDEAQVQIERALLQDPLNPEVQAWYGLHLIFSGQHAAAAAHARKLIALDSDNWTAHVLLKSALHETGSLDEELTLAKRLYIHTGNSDVVRALDLGYKTGGYRGAMRSAATVRAAQAGRLYVLGNEPAVLYANAGDNDRAMEWLEKAYADHSPDMVHLGVAPDWNNLRSDPRFQALQRRMNFPH